MYRVGLGYDIHPFAPEAGGRPLVLGGVPFPGERALAGHSDADVVVHALCDALLGSLGLGDIGQHFPDSSPRWKGISSLKLLGRVVEMLHEKGWRPVNVDLTLVAEAPRIAPAAAEMRTTLARTLGTNAAAVSVKATRPEGLGPLGAGQGMSCMAVALVTRSYPPGPKGPVSARG